MVFLLLGSFSQMSRALETNSRTSERHIISEGSEMLCEYALRAV
jgi:hypothetical protein